MNLNRECRLWRCGCQFWTISSPSGRWLSQQNNKMQEACSLKNLLGLEKRMMYLLIKYYQSTRRTDLEVNVGVTFCPAVCHIQSTIWNRETEAERNKNGGGSDPIFQQRFNLAARRWIHKFRLHIKEFLFRIVVAGREFWPGWQQRTE